MDGPQQGQGGLRDQLQSALLQVHATASAGRDRRGAEAGGGRDLAAAEGGRIMTRGLDPHVPLPESGTPWLGEIPAHWDIWKVGHFAAVGNGSTPNRDNADYWTE